MSNSIPKFPLTSGVRLITADTNGLFALEKPPGVLSHPNKKGEKGRSLLNAEYDAKRQAYKVLDTDEIRWIYLLNRLDSATSGVVLLSWSAKVGQAVLQAFERKQVRKVYTALVFGAPRSSPPLWRDRISVQKAEGSVRSSTGGGVGAETKLVKVEPLPGQPLVSRLTLMPLTGRTHQLRVQTAKRHVPIVGDRTYGDFQKNKAFAKSTGVKRLHLHCIETELNYLLAGKVFRFKARSESPF